MKSQRLNKLVWSTWGLGVITIIGSIIIQNWALFGLSISQFMLCDILIYYEDKLKEQI